MDKETKDNSEIMGITDSRLASSASAIDKTICYALLIHCAVKG